MVRLWSDGLLGLLSLGGNLSLLLLGLEDRLNDLLLLNQKGTDDAVTNALRAARTSISAGDGTGVLRDTSILLGAEVGDLWKGRKQKNGSETRNAKEGR